MLGTLLGDLVALLALLASCVRRARARFRDSVARLFSPLL